MAEPKICPYMYIAAGLMLLLKQYDFTPNCKKERCEMWEDGFCRLKN